MLNKFKLSKRLIAVLVLIVVAALSIFVFSEIATSPKMHEETIKSLDEKKLDVMELTAATSATSVLLAAVPSDATTPIANKIADLSSYLIIVVCAIFLEKILVTTTGFLTFKFLIPIACLLLAVYIYKQEEALKALALKLIAFGLIVIMIVPVSIQISAIVDSTFNTQETIESAKQNADNIDDVAEGVTAEESESFWLKIKNGVTNGASAFAKKAEETLNNFIDAIAALIITSCVIPIVVLLSFVWIINCIFGTSIKPPKINKIAPKMNLNRLMTKMKEDDVENE